ncbi:zinc finger ZZ-type and EF-hand domain-containing protein 1-like [Liolophura sinensis]|uniref:zinc finger ZZ-type and EF-hand domain-containing protein 1-like n=1 Tax=Liolophura sinensis TaxID=3198878 RepID=UPI0031583B8C
MGNTYSSSDTSSDVSDDGRMDNNKEDECLSDGDGDIGDRDEVPSGNLDMLFNPTALRTAASKMKDEIPENVLQQHCSHILKWLEDRDARMEETISLAQFCDMLSSRGVSKEEAVKAFQQFDVEGSGVAEVSGTLDALRSTGGGSLQGDLNHNIRVLQACSLIPGFVDVFASDQHAVRQHGDRILKFLLWNRAPSSYLPFPILNGFNNTSNMRLSVLMSIIKSLRESAVVETTEINAGNDEVKLMTKCFSSLEVSSNTSDACRLTNGDPSACWQSDGAARSHWIRLRMKTGLVLKQLSVEVAAGDQSYMPQTITVSVGKTVHNLREIRVIRVPSHMTGDLTLVENLKIFYPIVQINIKRCHSDGCDTRIHGLKTLGYRIVKESGISVTEAAEVWYLQVVAATALAAMPIAPHLRTAILGYTESALQHMSPLSLSPTSVDKPAMLSSHVLQEVDKFIREISLNPDGSISTEGLQVLLTFNIARGHVAGILRALKLLLERPSLNLETMQLLHKLQSVRDSFWEKHGCPLSMSLCGCDGGKTDENSAPDNVLSGNWTAQAKAYISAEGCTKVNMFFKAPDFVQITKLRIKVCSGAKGARCGLVFVFKDDSEGFKLEDQVEKFKVYDSWGALEYKFSTEVRAAGIGGKPDNPVAYFTLEDDWDEVEVPVSWYPTGQYVLVKFMEPRQPGVGRIGILGIKFYGFNRTCEFVEGEMDSALPNPKKVSTVNSHFMTFHTLRLLGDLARDQCINRKGSFLRPEHLDLGESPLDVIWEMYTLFEKDLASWSKCRLLLLQLLHSITPYITIKQQEPKVSAEQLFQHLCTLVDSPMEKEDGQLISVVKQLLIDGAAIFFSDKEARRKQLFKMMENVTVSGDSPSVTLVFQSLCQFFSTVDPSGLLDLPKHPSADFESGPVLSVMDTLISVSYREFCGALQAEDVSEQHNHLVHLVCCLQTSLLSWCWRHLTVKEEDVWRTVASQVITQYTVNVGQKAADALRLLNGMDPEKLTRLFPKLLVSFLGSVVRQMVCLLTSIGSQCDSRHRVATLNNLQPALMELCKLSHLVPDIFPKIGSEHWSQVNAEDVVLRTWHVESSHNYENNQHTTQVFSCPGATSFVVEFDPRCETERRYDYLEFTDSRGIKRRFDMKVGTEKWPRLVTFAGGHRLHFLFHSDGSNNEWGYKFKLTAKGCPDSPLCWPFDLQLSLAKLFGRLCGSTLDAKGFCLRDAFSEVIHDGRGDDQDLLRSELWTTLFRGGYMIGKLQRSLSGKFAAEDATVANQFLWDLIEQKEGPSTNLLKRCQDQSKGLPRQRLGGEEVDAAIICVFAALLWHTQQLREDITRYVQSCEVGESVNPISDGIFQAYNAAEYLRMHLLAQRQIKKKQLADSADHTNTDSNIEDDPVILCKGKALYLLKFAGLSKVQLKHELKQKTSKQLFKKVSNKKLYTGLEKLIKADFDSVGFEKYPAFKLVIEFVRDPAWSSERVNRLLQERSQHAQAVAEVYMFASEFIRQTSEDNIFQIPTVLFLSEMLSFQDSFAKHYAEGLDGCGLDLESRVRKSYYVLIRRLVDSFQGTQRRQLKRNMANAYDFIQACLLHFLDTQWQPYDFSFISEVKLPSLFFDIAKETVKMRDRTVAEQEENKELREYEQCKTWFQECSADSGKGFSTWYHKHDGVSSEERKPIQMFVAKFSDLLDVEISCDGCSVTLPGRRYRCLQCEDMDLCATCYAGGVKPYAESDNSKHTDDHDMVYLMYKCNKCQSFIVGTRIHCNVCEDFDLCLGCHITESFPSGHSSEHDITKFPMVKLKNTKRECDSLLQAYIHQHVWLLYSTLALCLVNYIYGTETHSQQGDRDYQQAAVQLHNQCIDIAMHCLLTVPKEAEGEVKSECEKQLEVRQEEAFAIHSQERIMGLLGAMVPLVDQKIETDSIYNFNNESFLQLLFKIVRRDSGHEVNTVHLAMGLLGMLLTRSTRKTADAAVKHEMTNTVKDAQEGQNTIEYLFDFGAKCLEWSCLDWAWPLSRILRKLYLTPEWKPVVMKHISECMDNLRQKPDLSSIFALFIIAGFPEILTIGTSVTYDLVGTDVKNGIVLKHFSATHQTLLIDVKTRKRQTVKDKYVECASSQLDILHSDHLEIFMQITKDIITRLKKGEVLSVEQSWVLSLALKALSKTLLLMTERTCTELYQTDFLQCVVYMASQGTGFSRQWLLKDLEVLSLMMYTHERKNAKLLKDAVKSAKLKSKKPVTAEGTVIRPGSATGSSVDPEKEAASEKKGIKIQDQPGIPIKESQEEELVTSDDEDSDYSLDSDSSCDKEIKEKCMEGIDEKTKMYFQTLHDQLKVPLDVLRFLYDVNEGNTAAIVLAIQENLEGEHYKTPDEIKKLTKKWHKNTSTPETSNPGDKAIDQGIQLFCLKKKSERQTLDKAKEEPSEETQKLIATPDKEVQEEILKQRKTKSGELWKSELERQEKISSREYLGKVNTAMAVLYSRQVLSLLLADWPRGMNINYTVLGCKDHQHIPCILDLLNRSDSREQFHQVVEKVIENCDQESMVAVAQTACQLMEEVSYSVETKESEHNYKNNCNIEETLHFPGATVLSVSFDPRCATEEGCDELVFSTSASYTQDKKVFSGTSHTNWYNFDVPGDTLYFRFTSDGSGTDWGYKFTVWASQRDGFDTGYLILNRILLSHSAFNTLNRVLPAGELWASLIYVACKQTSCQRLKVIQLLLRIIHSEHRNGSSSCLSIDLSLLKPLWKLYCGLSKQGTDTVSVVSPVTRALTELFLMVENLAIERGVVNSYLLSVQDLDELRKRVVQGLRNVAAVSVQIGEINLATKLCSKPQTTKKTN